MSNFVYSNSGGERRLSNNDPHFINPKKVFDKLLLKGQLSTRYFDEKGHFQPTELSKDLRNYFAL